MALSPPQAKLQSDNAPAGTSLDGRSGGSAEGAEEIAEQQQDDRHHRQAELRKQLAELDAQLNTVLALADAVHC
jgi:hypothetical protein